MDLSAPLKRFYKTVAIIEDGDGFAVTLDNKKLKTPAKRQLILPSRALADALAKEWDDQEEHILPLTMPMMALVSTAVDRIGQLREGVIGQIAKYAETDLICYWTEEPEELAARQSKTWTPFLDWAKTTYNTEFKVHTSIMSSDQPDDVVGKIKQAVNAYNDWELAALSSATHCTGSIIIALALMNNHVDASKAFEASQVDETYQIELWGEDWEAQDRREAILNDLNNVVTYLGYL